MFSPTRHTGGLRVYRHACLGGGEPAWSDVCSRNTARVVDLNKARGLPRTGDAAAPATTRSFAQTARGEKVVPPRGPLPPQPSGPPAPALLRLHPERQRAVLPSVRRLPLLQRSYNTSGSALNAVIPRPGLRDLQKPGGFDAVLKQTTELYSESPIPRGLRSLCGAKSAERRIEIRRPVQNGDGIVCLSCCA